MSIRTLIVDDEVLARKRIRKLLSGEPDLEIIGECTNGRAAVDAIRTQRPDLLFLDVQMPELDGLSVLEAIDLEQIPCIIFVTAYDQYALRAFEMHAMDYLLKPFDRRRFQKTLQRARSRIQREKVLDLPQRWSGLLEDLRASPKPLDRLVIKSGDRVYFLKMPEIDWIEASDNYVRLHVGKESHLYRESMKQLESQLDSDKFVRIHRSTIVNIERVKELRAWFHGDYIVILQDDTRLRLSRSYREKLSKRLGKHF